MSRSHFSKTRKKKVFENPVKLISMQILDKSIDNLEWIYKTKMGFLQYLA